MSYLINKEAQQVSEDGSLSPTCIGRIVRAYEIEGVAFIEVKTATFSIVSSLKGWVIRDKPTNAPQQPPPFPEKQE